MAVGEVSENPSSNTVTRPTVPKTRDEDIDRKFHIYGIFQAFSYGKLPSNKQIDVALTGAVESNVLTNPSKDLSPEGRDLVKDLRDVIDSAKYLWLKKNYNEEMQSFLYHTFQASTTVDSIDVTATISQSKANDKRVDALHGLRTLGRLLVTNGQFRKLLEDSLLLVRDMIADGVSKITSKLRPEQGRLDKIDEPTPDHTWHEKPPSFDKMKDILRPKPNDAKNQTQILFGEAHREAQGVQNVSRSETDQSDPQEAGRSDIDTTTTTELQPSKQYLSGRVSDERKGQAQDVIESTKNRAKDYLKQKIPRERRDKAIIRLKKMIVEIQQHEDYMEAIDTLILLTKEYIGRAESTAKDTNREARHLADDPNLQKARNDLKTLLENFADSTSMDDIFDATDKLLEDVNNDMEFKEWTRSLDPFISKCLREQGYIFKDELTDEWDRLWEQGQYFLRDRYKEHTDRLTDEMVRWFDYMNNDPDSVAFSNKLQKLFLDLGQDKDGNFKFKEHLLSDVTDVIIPGFFKNLGYIPIPRIEYSDPNVDAVIENLVIESENLMPNILEVQAETFWRFGRKKIHNRNNYRISIHVSQIQCDMKDVAYYVKKKRGFPRISDTGIMDVLLGGQGLSLDMKFSAPAKTDQNRIFKLKMVKANVKNLNIVLKKSNHKTLFAIFKPLLMAIVKPAITKAAETQIRRSFDQLDEQLWLIQDEYNKAKEVAKNKSPEETTNVVNMYIRAVQRSFSKLREFTKEKTPNAKVNFGYAEEVSMFPNILFLDGVSTKAMKYREMARAGDEWRSPVFDFCSARAPSKLIHPKQITRKSPYHGSRAAVDNHPEVTISSNPDRFDDASRSRAGYVAGSGASTQGTSDNQPQMGSATDSLGTAID